MAQATRYHNTILTNTRARADGPRRARIDQLFYTWSEFLTLGRRVGRSLDNALALAERGWPEGLAMAQAITGAIIDRFSASIKRPEMRLQDHPGMDFDLGLVLAGEPEHWINIEPVDAEHVYKIVLNCSVTSGISNNAIMWRGATVAALVQLLEQGGHRCEVVVMDATDNMSDLFDDEINGRASRVAAVIECYCTVKEAAADLDLDRVTFALAHPDMERRLMFGIEARTSHGVAVECVPEQRGDLYMPCAVYGQGANWNDRAACEAWVASQLRAQGVLMDAD